MTNRIPSLLRLLAGSSLLIFLAIGEKSVFALPSDREQSGSQTHLLPHLTQKEHMILVKNWQISSVEHDISAQIDLPMLAPSSWEQVDYKNIFWIPDSLQSRNLTLHFGTIRGIASVKLNNIAIRRRLNYPTGFAIPIPQNLLNTSGENTLEITINRPESPEEGIPDMVRLFSRAENLGICGEILLTWDSNVYFSDFSYRYSEKNLTYNYQLSISDPEKILKGPFPKVRCEEKIIAPDGKIVHKRFEYLDLTEMNKQFARSIPIADPQFWSADTSLFYTIYFRSFSGHGLIASHEQKIALREFDIKSGKFYINSQPTKIKGCTYRIDYPIYSDKSLSKKMTDFYAQIKNDFIDIKRLGFNAIRFPQDTAHPYCYVLADSLGLYLFIENGLWRIPEPYFKNDRLLQASKTIADEAIKHYAQHPSFVALGLGTEIPIHLPAVEKFILILKRYIEQRSTVSLYTIPLNYQYLNSKPITNFYIYNKYDTSLLTDYQLFLNHFNIKDGIKPIWGNVGFSLSSGNNIEDHTASERIQSAKMNTFFQLLNNNPDYNGFFIETYKDWQSGVSAQITLRSEEDKCIYPYGLISWDGTEREIYRLMPKLLDDQVQSVGSYFPENRKTNFFSISVFILSVLFFYIYRRDFRFRENLKRSLSHPFGFFVDLRDRRIISIIDSTIIGIYTNFLVASIIAAYLYSMSNNLLVTEYLSSVLVPMNLDFFYVNVIDSPLKIFFLIWLIFYFLQLAVVILLKILNLFAVEKIRFRQYLAICNWAGAPLLFLLPASLLSYHLMRYDWYHWLAIIILGIFFIWYNFRLGNSLRVLLTMSVFKAFSLLILAYGGFLLLFGTIFETKYGLMTYFRLLTEANLLF